MISLIPKPRSGTLAIPLPRWPLWVATAGVLAGLLATLWTRHPIDQPPTESSASPAEVARTNLLLQGQRFYEKETGRPFTGWMVNHYPDGSPRSRSSVSNGWLHGLSQGWHTNGQLQVAETFVQGVSHGLRTKWYASGAKLSEAAIVEGNLHGPFRRWHENGTLSERIQFKAGEPEGTSLAYFPSGHLKARVVARAGRVVERQSWNDGVAKP